MILWYEHKKNLLSNKLKSLTFRLLSNVKRCETREVASNYIWISICLWANEQSEDFKMSGTILGFLKHLRTFCTFSIFKHKGTTSFAFFSDQTFLSNLQNICKRMSPKNWTPQNDKLKVKNQVETGFYAILLFNKEKNKQFWACPTNSKISFWLSLWLETFLFSDFLFNFFLISLKNKTQSRVKKRWDCN